MSDAILVINAGSSSIKFSVFAANHDPLRLLLDGQIEELSSAPLFTVTGADGDRLAHCAWPRGQQLAHGEALAFVMDFLAQQLGAVRLIGVGHRVVHGGLQFGHPVRVDAAVAAQLARFIPLAPLHQPHNLAPIHDLLERWPDLPQVACFDTAFHRTNADLEQMFGLPQPMFAQGLRRYGFHGLSYEYISSVLPRYSARAAAGSTLVLHLGNGASICALRSGCSVATTMGFTAVDGLLMGTRSGSLDPGLVLHLLDQHGMDVRSVQRLLYSESGLLGVSGLSSDMRTLLVSDAPRARLAVDLFCYRIRREIGALAAILGGVDAIVFTAGIGANSPQIRARVLRDAAWLGVDCDEAANAVGGPVISSATSRIEALSIPTDEEQMIARHTCALVRTSCSPPTERADAGPQTTN